MIRGYQVLAACHLDATGNTFLRASGMGRRR